MFDHVLHVLDLVDFIEFLFDDLHKEVVWELKNATIHRIHSYVAVYYAKGKLETAIIGA